MQYFAADDVAAQQVTSQAAAEEPGTLRHTASQQGSGSAANALEAFLDSAAQPTSRHAQSYSRYSSSSSTPRVSVQAYSA